MNYHVTFPTDLYSSMNSDLSRGRLSLVTTPIVLIPTDLQYFATLWKEGKFTLKADSI